MTAQDPQRVRAVEKFATTAAANQTLTLTRAATGKVVLTLGGIVQDPADYTVDRTTIRLTGITPEVDTVALVDYEYDR